MEILLATKNNSKIKEMNSIFKDTDIRFIPIDKYKDIPETKEDGETFHQNAFKKATVINKILEKTVLSEDSGLEVDALNGAPGVFSARFAGENATDTENIDKLLHLIRYFPENKRTAKFISVFCLIKDNKEMFFEGEVKGIIIDIPRGESGFGYDPVFVPDGYNKTFSELGDTIKNRISHRAKAMKKLKEYLMTLTTEDTEIDFFMTSH